jgi:predicted GNAT family acetyltransferase
MKRLTPNTEAAVRIRGLETAYGVHQEFLHVWCLCDDKTTWGYLSLLDTAATLEVKKSPFEDDESPVMEELTVFLSMQTAIQTVRTSARTAKALAKKGGWLCETGIVMTPGAELDTASLVPTDLTVRETYPLLEACFQDGLPPFSSWYTDVSHRVRHGCSRIAGFRDGERSVACAMTTAECDGAALIGAVATLPEGRGKGYASANVLTLAHRLLGEEKRVFLSPKNEHARALYERIGFVECGRWGSLKRQ